jgi:hypothetical protein
LKDDDTTEEHFAESETEMGNDIVITGSTSGLECSFAGGCEYEITSTGLAQMIKNDSSINYITVCDEVCEFQLDDSDDAYAKCKVPELSTIYSNE